jgi:hypothetical protein
MAKIIGNLIMIKEILKERVNLFQKYHKVDHKYSCYEELVLDCGFQMRVQPLPPTIEKGRPKECYWNCQKLVFENPNLTYVEGFMFMEDTKILINHAWLLTENQEAVDPTINHKGNHYFGVAFNIDWLISFFRVRYQAGKIQERSVFECNYLEKFSLLRDGLPSDAIVNHLVDLKS